MFIECSIQIQIIKTMPLDNLTTLPKSHSCFWTLLFSYLTLHYILIQVTCLMSIYKDTKITFFEFCFSECNTSYIQLQEISLIVKKWEPIALWVFFFINDRWKIYHRLVARWIYDIQLWPPNFIGWPLTIFAGWHPPLVDAEHNWKLISQQTTTNWNYCTHTIINQLIWMPNLFNT